MSHRRQVYVLTWVNTEGEENEIEGIYGTRKRALDAAREIFDGHADVDEHGGWVYQEGEDREAPIEAYLYVSTYTVQ